MVATNARRLAAAILLRAAQDAMADDPKTAVKARRWLVGECAAGWLAELEIPEERVTAWLSALPGLPYEQLELTLSDG